MIAIGSGLMGVFAVWKKRSPIVFAVMAGFIWLICAFTYGNADELIYISRYEKPEAWVGQTEVIYMLLIQLFRHIGCSFQVFKASMAAIQIILIGSVVWRFSKHPNIVLLAYFIFPFFLDVAQMRNALATSVMIFSVGFLMDDEKEEQISFYLTKNEWKYIAGILIATGIHTASFFWILLLVAKKCTQKMTVIITIVVCLTFSVIITSRVIAGIAGVFGAEQRIAAYVSSAYAATRMLYFQGMFIRVMLYAVGALMGIWIIKNDSETRQNTFCLKCNIIMICILPVLLYYTTEIYRMQVGISILNYITMSNGLDGEYEGTGWTSLWNVAVILCICLFAALFLYLYVLSNDNMNTVFYPIFENNRLQDLLR